MPEPTPKVQVLDDTTANQIAAGEVVERPAAAVKELVENALDAGARRIVVELEEGGKQMLRVADDGCGMSASDAVLSLQRHATSKIRTADDLFRITTMGFRGEALPSIASVSQLTLVTCEEGAEAGTSLVVSGGALESVTEAGARTGTTITVENLFFNVPARLKFLKSAQTELGHIVELMQRLALARPDVAFRLLHGGGEVFATNGNGSLMDACVPVFGRDTARHLVPLTYNDAGVRVTGYVGTPAALKGHRGAQHTFVNRRFVRSKAATRALDEAYKSVQTLHGTRYPAAVILIDIDPSQVDVNVSPTKTEVRFTREGDIYTAVYRAVQEALMAGGLVPTLIGKATAPPAPESGGAHAQSSLLSVPNRPPARTHQDVTAFHQAMQERARPLPSASDDPFEDGPPGPPSLGGGSSAAWDALRTGLSGQQEQAQRHDPSSPQNGGAGGTPTPRTARITGSTI